MEKQEIEQAKIIGIVAGMFAGKTSELLDIRTKRRYAGLTDIVFRAKPDAERFGDRQVVTHSGRNVESIVFKNSHEIMDHVESFKKTNGYYPDTAYIIEAPFTDSGLIEIVNDLALTKGIGIVYDTLNMTSEGDGFPFILDEADKQRTIGDLIQISDEIIPVAAVCVEASRRGEDQTEASRTQFKHWIYGPKTDALNVGGKEKYEARSVKHWHPSPYEGMFEQVLESAKLEGLIEGYVLDVSRTPASLLTIYRNDEGIYARFAAKRDMEFTREGYQRIRNEHSFIPVSRPTQLLADQHSFMLTDSQIVVGNDCKIRSRLDSYLKEEVPKLDRKDQQYITEEVQRSYGFLF